MADPQENDTTTNPARGRTGFHPFPDFVNTPNGVPAEPPVGTVLAWQIADGAPAVAVRAPGGWFVTGEEEPVTWQGLADGIGEHRNWLRVGKANAWVPLVPVDRPKTRGGADQTGTTP